MKWLLRLLIVGAVIAVGWWVWQRIFVTDERRIQKLIATMERAVEQNNLLRLEGSIAPDYSDGYGLNKTALIGAVRSAHQQYNQIFIHISNLKITVNADHQQAQAVCIVKILARSAGGSAETEIRTEHPQLHFAKGDQGWRLTKAETSELKFE